MTQEPISNCVTAALGSPGGRIVEKFVTLNTGRNFPLIGFGTYTIHGSKLIYDCLDAALAAGYRAIDTAAVYGNEEDVGKALRTLLPKYNLTRADIFLTSKLSPKDHGANKVYNGAMSSLNKLGVTYLDLYLIHWPGASGVPMESKENKKLRAESWKGLEDLQKSGKLRAIGVSNYTTRHLEELLKICTVKPAVNQVEFSIHYRQSEDLFKLCADEQIVLQSYTSLGGNDHSKSLLDDSVVGKVAGLTKVSPSQVLLRWVLQSGYAIIPKSTHKERIEENSQLDFSLSESRMNALNSISTRMKYAWNPDTVEIHFRSENRGVFFEMCEEDCQPRADVIVEKVFSLYKSLGKSGKPTKGEWTCLAAFIQQEETCLKVVSLATGTKCIGGNSMRADGSVVHDSHAEVLARRNFLRYLYCQVGLAKKSESSSIFTVSNGKYYLRDGVKYHLYVSQVPCGDASIIPMADSELSEGIGEPPKKRQKTDVHRTGAKPVPGDRRQDAKGAGVDYHVRGAVRHKPGRGDPTKSLSCSDKMTKWLFCGVQGALLSTLISDPVELTTIVVGPDGPYDETVFKQALFERSGLTTPPTVLRSQVPFESAPNPALVRPCSASIHWANVSTNQWEVSVEGRRLGATKKNTKSSRLLTSKFSLYNTYVDLAPSSLEVDYKTAKIASVDYQEKRARFVAAMGSWSEDKSSYESFHIRKTVQ